MVSVFHCGLGGNPDQWLERMHNLGWENMLYTFTAFSRWNQGGDVIYIYICVYIYTNQYVICATYLGLFTCIMRYTC